MDSAEVLNGAIAEAMDAGSRIPCRRRSTKLLWTSDAPADREQAVTLCAGCPTKVAAACLARAEAVRAVAGVWCGVDFALRSAQTWRHRGRRGGASESLEDGVARTPA